MEADTPEARLYTLARMGYAAYLEAYRRRGHTWVLSWEKQEDVDREAWLAATAEVAGVLLRAQEVEQEGR